MFRLVKQDKTGFGGEFKDARRREKIRLNQNSGATGARGVKSIKFIRSNNKDALHIQ